LDPEIGDEPEETRIQFTQNRR